MKRTLSLKATALTTVLLAVAAGCTMKNQETPPLTGPSEYGTGITVSATPDAITQDGASQSLITVSAFDSNGKPLRNLSLRSEIYFGGTRVDFGSLSARNIVTDANGKATLVYTAPSSPAGFAVDTGNTVQIAVTPLGTNFDNEVPRLTTIRLVPPGIVVPADGLVPSFTATSADDHEPVFFDATASKAGPNNAIAAYSWSFGDGSTGSGATTSHTYSAAGSYQVTLTISDGLGRSAQTSRTVTVGAGDDPTASFLVSPANAQVGQTVNFDGSASRAGTGRTIRSYKWNFGDGDSKTTTTPTTTHDYISTGSFTATLVVTDDAGRTDSANNNVSVGTPGGPTASFTTSPSNPSVNGPVFFNASASTAASGRTIVSYAWDFGDGSRGNNVTTSHAYGAAGVYLVTLTVTDDAGRTANDTDSITVGAEAGPIADFSFSPTDASAGQTISFNGSLSTAPTGRTIINYHWDFGNGEFADASRPETSRPYNAKGTYLVTLIVTDSTGKVSRPTSHSLTIK